MNEQAKLSQLNQHPLNQAALERLTQEARRPTHSQCHLLDLAHLASAPPEDAEEREDAQAEQMLGAWGQSMASQKVGISLLEGGLSPEEVMEMPLPTLAQVIVETLQTASATTGE